MTAIVSKFRSMKLLMIVTDVGFVVYWLITALHLLPPDWLYKDYTNQLLVHWNWSFFPLDILVSATGTTSLLLARRGDKPWRQLALVSLTLTSVSGLQAISFWVFSGDFNIGWWLPNLFLLLYPLWFIPRLVRSNSAD